MILRLDSVRLALAEFVLLFAAIGIGCNSQQSPNGAMVDRSQTRRQTDDLLANMPLPMLRSFRLTADDPSLDGWDSEDISRRGMQQLNELGEIILGKSTEQDLESIATSEARCSSLLPTDLPVVFRDDVFEVRRGQTSEALPNSQSLPTGISNLRNLAAKLDNVHFKFKLFRVDLQAAAPSTQQYFHLSGQNSEGRHEYNATWEIDWTATEKGKKLKIESIRLIDVEHVSANSSIGQPMLVDCTSSLVQDWPIYQEALLRNIAHWHPRIEDNHGVYNFGHHGLAIGDINGDGLDDIYICQTGAIPNHLLVQQEDGTVRDEAQAASLDYLDNTRSALFIDLDNDSDQDLVVALASGIIFLENDGKGRFQERAKISSVTQGFSMAAADYDLDGLTDLYVCVYYGPKESISNLPLPLPYFDATNGGSNHLIRNDGNWRFSDVTEATGLDQDNRRFSFASAWEDIDNDGDSDLLVVNDFGPNHLYRNDEGQFKEIAKQVGLLDGAFGMSASFGDYDHDGQADLYVSNMFSAAGNRVTFQPRFKSQYDEETRAKFQHLARGNSLFRNLGNNRFEDVSVEAGVTMGRWSWASQFVDINNDSWEDLLVTNGFITGESTDDM
ncbi:MAG: VCBS repeat-containing protein [Pirellulaceae bacterium]|nr:VCBS repeat-containing protein [Pirellulaceae bacterium]